MGLAYDGTKDLGRTKMTMTKPPAMVENLVYTITDNGNGSGTLTLAWKIKAPLCPSRQTERKLNQDALEH